MIDDADARVLRESGYRVLRIIPGRDDQTLLAACERDESLVVIHADPPERDRAARVNGTNARHAIRAVDLLSGATGTLYFVEEYASRGAVAAQLELIRSNPGCGVTAIVPLLEHLIDRDREGAFASELRCSDLLLDGDGRLRVRSGVHWTDLSHRPEAVAARTQAILAVQELVTVLGSHIPGLSEWVARREPFDPSEWPHLLEWLCAHVPAMAIPEQLPRELEGIPGRIPLRHETGFEVTVDPARRSVARTWVELARERIRSRLTGRMRVVTVAIVVAVGCAGVALWALPAKPEAHS